MVEMTCNVELDILVERELTSCQRKLSRALEGCTRGWEIGSLLCGKLFMVGVGSRFRPILLALAR
jgi:hypothetical protein